ncbi:hypothetical protein VCHA43P273_130073 [Vibrio chagasii]|nr:hypothetical protein VCHA43P273_130073 [Vibrio chagasii]CAH7003988.1 hypothetical protein VCHA34P115_50243 [Vibrio chagasii]CAH7126080.1 hypothetical protein VCHA37P193_280073 [Vibrio chagasii]CAH7141901.1 hypothetical protein VCHA42P256_20246 [Vibrio chagasii]CAH7169415.1 hypothetical protein VCHA38P215_20259 [Vibrio chagasii]
MKDQCDIRVMLFNVRYDYSVATKKEATAVSNGAQFSGGILIMSRSSKLEIRGSNR